MNDGLRIEIIVGGQCELMSNLKEEFLNTLMELAPDVDGFDEQESIIHLAISKYNKITSNKRVSGKLTSKIKESQIVDSLLYALDTYEDKSVIANNSTKDLDRILRQAYRNSDNIGFDLVDDNKDLHVFFDEEGVDDRDEDVEDDENYTIHDELHNSDNNKLEDCFENLVGGKHRSNWNIV